MNDERRKKLNDRRQNIASALNLIENAMELVMNSQVLLRDIPFMDDAKKPSEVAWENLRRPQKAVVVAGYDTDKELADAA